MKKIQKEEQIEYTELSEVNCCNCYEIADTIRHQIVACFPCAKELNIIIMYAYINIHVFTIVLNSEKYNERFLCLNTV